MILGLLIRNTIYGPTSVSFSPDGTQIACGTEHGELIVWDLSTAEPFPERQTSYIHQVIFSPDGKLRVSTSDREVVVKEIQSERKNIEPIDQFGYPIAFSPDGERLLCVRDKNITVWYIPAVRLALQFSVHHCREAAYLAFSADGTRIISGDENGDFRTWDAVTGAAIVKIPTKRHQAGTLAVAFSSSFSYTIQISPDGKWITTRCDANCMHNHKHGFQVWDSATGDLATTMGHQSMGCITFSPDSKRIAYTLSDCNFYIQTLNFIPPM